MKLEFRVKMIITGIAVLVFLVACGASFFNGNTLIGALFALMVLKRVVSLIIWDDKKKNTRRRVGTKAAHAR